MDEESASESEVEEYLDPPQLVRKLSAQNVLALVEDLQDSVLDYRMPPYTVVISVVLATMGAICICYFVLFQGPSWARYRDDKIHERGRNISASALFSARRSVSIAELFRHESQPYLDKLDGKLLHWWVDGGAATSSAPLHLPPPPATEAELDGTNGGVVQAKEVADIADAVSGDGEARGTASAGGGRSGAGFADADADTDRDNSVHKKSYHPQREAVAAASLDALEGIDYSRHDASVGHAMSLVMEHHNSLLGLSIFANNNDGATAGADSGAGTHEGGIGGSAGGSAGVGAGGGLGLPPTRAAVLAAQHDVSIGEAANLAQIELFRAPPPDNSPPGNSRPVNNQPPNAQGRSERTDAVKGQEQANRAARAANLNLARAVSGRGAGAAGGAGAGAGGAAGKGPGHRHGHGHGHGAGKADDTSKRSGAPAPGPGLATLGGEEPAQLWNGLVQQLPKKTKAAL
jgi:hypothetical protein